LARLRIRDVGWLTVIDTLTDQKNHFDFASYGIGSRIQLWTTSAVRSTRAFPAQGGQTKANEARVTFKAGLDY